MTQRSFPPGYVPRFASMVTDAPQGVQFAFAELERFLYELSYGQVQGQTGAASPTQLRGDMIVRTQPSSLGGPDVRLPIGDEDDILGVRSALPKWVQLRAGVGISINHGADNSTISALMMGGGAAEEGPQGEEGPPGPPGVAGPQGPAGPPIAATLEDFSYEDPMLGPFIPQQLTMESSPIFDSVRLATALGIGPETSLRSNALRLSASGVAHGMTSEVPTDVFGQLYPGSLTEGGMSVLGLTDTSRATTIPLHLIGVDGGTTPTVPPVRITAYKKNGTTVQAVAATEYLLWFATAGNVVARMWGDGGLRLDGGLTLGAVAASPIVGALTGLEITAPAAPAANGWTMYGQDNGAGKTQVMILFNTGAAQQVAIQP